MHEMYEKVLTLVASEPRKLHAADASNMYLGSHTTYLYIVSVKDRMQDCYLYLTVSATSESRKSICKSPLGILLIWRTSPKL